LIGHTYSLVAALGFVLLCLLCFFVLVPVPLFHVKHSISFSAIVCIVSSRSVSIITLIGSVTLINIILLKEKICASSLWLVVFVFCGICASLFLLSLSQSFFLPRSIVLLLSALPFLSPLFSISFYLCYSLASLLYRSMFSRLSILS
jgi:hypothetical protein